MSRGRYEALGATAALGAVAGAASGLLFGRCIDRGGRRWMVPRVASALAAGIALRAVEGWVPVGPGVLHHATGAAVGALYGPVLMSVPYDRARRSGSAFRYRLAAETGWDAGASLGCGAAACAA